MKESIGGGITNVPATPAEPGMASAGRCWPEAWVNRAKIKVFHSRTERACSMAANRARLAVILHADIVGSTALVQGNESIAHDRMRDAFVRFSETIRGYAGIPHELRGDALLAKFSRVSDAIAASLTFQANNAELNENLDHDIRPQLRIGISLGEVIVADGTLTGPDVVLAQRLEQLAEHDPSSAQELRYHVKLGRDPQGATRSRPRHRGTQARRWRNYPCAQILARRTAPARHLRRARYLVASG